MEKPDQLRGLFQMQTALDERLNVKKNAVLFKRQDNGCTKKKKTTQKLLNSAR